jgi:hypothetical protein
LRQIRARGEPQAAYNFVCGNTRSPSKANIVNPNRLGPIAATRGTLAPQIDAFLDRNLKARKPSAGAFSTEKPVK